MTTFKRRQSLGPICAGLRSHGRLQGIGGSGFRKPPPDKSLADEIADAAFGKQATRLAEAEWHPAHGKETE